MASIHRRVQRQVRSAIDFTSRVADTDAGRVALSILGGPAAAAYLYRDEIADLWRRDDRMKQKFERRAARDTAAYNAAVAEREFIRQANARARAQAMSLFGYSDRIGDGRTFGGNRLETYLGESNLMNRYLGGGA